jgi:hypothetical protein
MARLWGWLWRWFKPRDDGPPEVLQAKALLRSIDAGGVPLNPAKVNAIARGLGLEVSKQAAMDDTLARIRLALSRAGH